MTNLLNVILESNWFTVHYPAMIQMISLTVLTIVIGFIVSYFGFYDLVELIHNESDKEVIESITVPRFITIILVQVVSIGLTIVAFMTMDTWLIVLPLYVLLGSILGQRGYQEMVKMYSISEGTYVEFSMLGKVR